MTCPTIIWLTKGIFDPMRALLLIFCFSLMGCDVIYHAPRVSDQVPDADVSIIPLTAAAARTANLSTYFPRTLPAAFFQNVGTGSGPFGTGGLPRPASSQQFRSSNIETRLPSPVPNTPYQIGIGDILIISTLQSASSIEEQSGLLTSQNRRENYTVQDDGSVAIPDVGRVQMAGLSLEDAETELFQALVSDNLDPTFSIEVSEFNSKRVSVGGAVNTPETLPITLTPLSLQEAIVAAGGATAVDTEFTAVRLYRNGQIYQVPYDALPNTDVTLIAGDSIFVNTSYELEEAQAYFAEQIALRQERQDAVTSERNAFEDRLAADAVIRDYVYLTGEVQTQGRFPLPFGRQATLADALFEQGGSIPDTGNPGEIYLLRGINDVQVHAFHLDGRNPINMLNATKIELRPNDIIFVSQQPVTRWNRVVQQLVPSLILFGASAVAN